MLTKKRSKVEWRFDDPPAKTVGELGPEDLRHRVVIRTKEFMGTIYGTLVGVHTHPALVHFTCVQVHGKKELVIRDDTEVVVLDF